MGNVQSVFKKMQQDLVFREKVYIFAAGNKTVAMTKNQLTILNQIKTKLNTVLPSNGYAVLYGSQARGDFHKKSDWDILIVIDQEKVPIAENTSITYPLVMFGWEMGIEINPVVYTKKEWESYTDTPFYENVMHDGMRIAG